LIAIFLMETIIVMLKDHYRASIHEHTTLVLVLHHHVTCVLTNRNNSVISVLSENKCFFFPKMAEVFRLCLYWTNLPWFQTRVTITATWPPGVPTPSLTWVSDGLCYIVTVMSGREINTYILQSIVCLPSSALWWLEHGIEI